MLSRGEGYDSIAAKTGTTEQVVKNRASGIIREMRCTNRVEAVATALRQGLIE